MEQLIAIDELPMEENGSEQAEYGELSTQQQSGSLSEHPATRGE